MTKKLLSVILAAVMVLGVMPISPVSATSYDHVHPHGIEDYPALELETDLVIDCEGYDYTYVTFTPSYTGTYVFYSDADGGDSEAELYDADMNYLDYGDDCAYDHDFHRYQDFCIVRNLEEGVTYILGVRYYSRETAQMTVRVDGVHSYASEVTKQATCTEDGELTYTCVTCGHSYTEVILAAHSYVSEITKQVTCTVDGELTYTCVTCGDSYIQVIPASHSYDYDGICTACGEKCATLAVGTCGEHLTWTLLENGTLAISGEGAMDNYVKVDTEYYFECDAPWFPYSNDTIKHIVIESGVTNIGDYAFLKCHNLEYVSIPSTVHTIGDYAFWFCGPPASEGVEQIPWQLDLPEGVTHIGEGAFLRCNNLRSVSFPSTLTTVGNSAFCYTGLKSVEIPGSLTVIPEDMFFETRSLESITLHEGIERIESGAFAYCQPSNIIIPSTVEYIGYGIISWCSILDKIVIYSKNYEIDDNFYIPDMTGPDDKWFTKWTDFYSYPGTQRPVPTLWTTLNYHDIPEFNDLPASEFYFAPVVWAVEQGITNGTGANTFSPTRECTRGEIVTFLWRAEGSPAPTSTEHNFTDVEPGYYYDAMLWAVENGITKGVNVAGTLFGPTNVCTRAQVVTFLWRAAGCPEPASNEHSFTDVKQDYYTDAMLWAVEQGITNGVNTDGTLFAPDRTCSRAEIVTFLYRAYNEG